MKKEVVIKRTENFVKKILGNEGTGHDFWHIERVRNNAKLINKTEKGDWIVIELAVLLHDIGDWKVIGKDEDDYSIAENFLKSQKISENITAQIMFIIKHMSFAKSLDQKIKSAPKEFYVVRDSDRLDALGAVGIARAFTYGGNRKRLMHDPTKKSRVLKNSKDYKNHGSSTIHHFYEKLLLLKDLMDTKTGKKIASNRDKFMREYLKQFFKEWQGKA